MRRHRCSFSLRRFFRWLTSDNFGERTLMIRRTSLLSTALVSVLCVLPNGALAQDVAAPAEVDGGIDRKSVVSGKSVSVRVDLGGRRIIQKKTKEQQKYTKT